jgi:hypothetical protein
VLALKRCDLAPAQPEVGADVYDAIERSSLGFSALTRSGDYRETEHKVSKPASCLTKAPAGVETVYGHRLPALQGSWITTTRTISSE